MNEVVKVEFNGSEIAVIEKDGTQYVAMKPIVEAMGLEWKKQQELIKRDPVLSSVTTIMVVTGADGKAYEMICLPIDYLNGWLFKVPASRYTGKRKETIIRYQKECYRVLFEYFHNGGAINPDATDSQITALLNAYEQKAYECACYKLENKQMRQSIDTLADFAIPDSAFGAISRATGLPRDIIVKAYHKSDKRRHEPQTERHIQLVLNLRWNGDELVQV